MSRSWIAVATLLCAVACGADEGIRQVEILFGYDATSCRDGVNNNTLAIDEVNLPAEMSIVIDIDDNPGGTGEGNLPTIEFCTDVVGTFTAADIPELLAAQQSALVPLPESGLAQIELGIWRVGDNGESVCQALDLSSLQLSVYATSPIFTIDSDLREIELELRCRPGDRPN